MAADPGAIDLEPYKEAIARRESIDFVSVDLTIPAAKELIAAVEALQARIRVMLPYEKACLAVTDWCTRHDRSDITSSVELLEAIEAAEARVGALAEALDNLLPHVWLPSEGPDVMAADKAYKEAKAVLAAVPEQAMERARSKDYAAGLEAAAQEVDKWHGIPHPREIAKAIRALGKEEKKP